MDWNNLSHVSYMKENINSYVKVICNWYCLYIIIAGLVNRSTDIATTGYIIYELVIVLINI